MTAVVIIGRLSRDPELRYTNPGKAVATLSVAENHRRKNAAGEWEDGSTTWWDVTLWQDQAENAANELHKGDRVIVTGDSYTEEYEKKDGTQGKSLKVRAQEVGKSVRFSSQSKSRPSGSHAPWSKPADDPWGTAAADAESPF